MEAPQNRLMPAAELLAELVKGLVAEPGRVQVEDREVHEGTSHLTIKVAPFDRGKVIGKGGKTIEAIRFVFMAMASLQGRRVFIEVDEPRQRIGESACSTRSGDGGISCGGESQPVKNLSSASGYRERKRFWSSSGPSGTERRYRNS